MLNRDLKELVSELENVATSFCANEYDTGLIVKVEVNSRLSKALGRFIYRRNNLTKEFYPSKIELSKKLLERGTHEQIIDVLKHECVHYCLFMNELPHNDGDPYFEEELRRLNISSTRTISIKHDVHIHECSICGEQITTKRKLKHGKWQHPKCGAGTLIYKQTISYDMV